MKDERVPLSDELIERTLARRASRPDTLLLGEILVAAARTEQYRGWAARWTPSTSPAAGRVAWSGIGIALVTLMLVGAMLAAMGSQQRDPAVLPGPTASNQPEPDRCPAMARAIGTAATTSLSPASDATASGMARRDGRIAYVSSDGGLWARDPDTGDEIGLAVFATRDVSIMDPVWSPDGGRLAFTLAAGPPGGATSCADVFVVDPDGTGLVDLTQVPEGDDAIVRSWSPDGSRLLISEGGGGERPGWALLGMDGSRVRLQAPGETCPVISGYHWSPDGTRIAAAGLGGHMACVLDIATGAWIRVGTEEILHDTLRWSADGRSLLAFGPHGGGPVWLEESPSDGSGTPRRTIILDSAGWDGGSEVLSPDRTRFIFTQSGGLYVSDVAGTGVVRLAVDVLPGGSAWSPDGSRVLYVVGPTLEVVDADGRRPRVVVTDFHPGSPFAWQPVTR